MPQHLEDGALFLAFIGVFMTMKITVNHLARLIMSFVVIRCQDSSA